jgi:hypothetical protein
MGNGGNNAATITPLATIAMMLIHTERFLITQAFTTMATGSTANPHPETRSPKNHSFHPTEPASAKKFTQAGTFLLAASASFDFRQRELQTTSPHPTRVTACVFFVENPASFSQLP